VIVVGNLTAGGTGKTPLVIWLAAALLEAGHAVGVISRGHGRSGSGLLVVGADSTPESVGDEALLLAQRTGCPVIVGRDRIAAARRAIELGASVIVSDDGLQHRRLERDFEIVVIDGRRRFGNGRLLPAGPLREAPRRLERIDAVVLNADADAGAGGAATGAGAGGAATGGPAAPEFRMTLLPGLLRPLGSDPAAASRDTGNVGRALAEFRGAAVHAVAGIGNPERFFALLRAAGLEPIEHVFPDHHRFTAAELRFGDALPIVMTEKDAVKCVRLGVERAWYLPVSAEIEGAAGLLAQITARLAAAAAARGARGTR
jgi:tetraacyldisaccharide 4'-kinase